jgi:hypothetical protein
MSWLSTALPSLANLFTTDPTLATSIFNSLGSKKTVASAVNAQLHSLSIVAMTNPAGLAQAISTTIAAIDSLPNVASLNVSDQINELATATDPKTLLGQIAQIENVLTPLMSSVL